MGACPSNLKDKQIKNVNHDMETGPCWFMFDEWLWALGREKSLNFTLLCVYTSYLTLSTGTNLEEGMFTLVLPQSGYKEQSIELFPLLPQTHTLVC